MIQKRYILTGGPGSGKTATLQQLASWGYVCVPEVARQVILERNSAGLPPRPAPHEFAAEIFKRDIAIFDSVADCTGPIFFDRGLVDALGMLHECGRMT